MSVSKTTFRRTPLSVNRTIDGHICKNLNKVSNETCPMDVHKTTHRHTPMNFDRTKGRVFWNSNRRLYRTSQSHYHKNSPLGVDGIKDGHIRRNLSKRSYRTSSMNVNKISTIDTTTNEFSGGNDSQATDFPSHISLKKTTNASYSKTSIGSTQMKVNKTSSGSTKMKFNDTSSGSTQTKVTRTTDISTQIKTNKTVDVPYICADKISSTKENNTKNIYGTVITRCNKCTANKSVIENANHFQCVLETTQTCNHVKYFNKPEEDELTGKLSYEILREKAGYYADLMKRYFEAARIAYESYQRAEAKELSLIGYEYLWLCREANEETMEAILESRKELLETENTLDLHDLHVNEAITAVRRTLEEREDDLYRDPLKHTQLIIVTGKGNHCVGGFSKLRHAVINWLYNHSYIYEKRDGSLCVQLNQLYFEYW